MPYADPAPSACSIPIRHRDPFPSKIAYTSSYRRSTPSFPICTKRNLLYKILESINKRKKKEGNLALFRCAYIRVKERYAARIQISFYLCAGSFCMQNGSAVRCCCQRVKFIAPNCIVQTALSPFCPCFLTLPRQSQFQTCNVLFFLSMIFFK